jgi:hypothetical protein
LSNVSSLKELVSKPFLSEKIIKSLEKIVFQKIGGKSTNKQQPQQLIEKSDSLRELVELCPYIFQFPTIKSNNNPPPPHGVIDMK